MPPYGVLCASTCCHTSIFVPICAGKRHGNKFDCNKFYVCLYISRGALNRQPYIYEMKDTLIRADTALKLCNQWHKGIEYIEEQYLNSLDGYSVESSLGVISGYGYFL